MAPFAAQAHPPGATGSLLPVPPMRRFPAVKIRDCRLYAANGRYEDPALPTILLAGGALLFFAEAR
ncbi:MAG: hypothetical protein ACLQNE_05805 [Thermoguttaceae bacterium]